MRHSNRVIFGRRWHTGGVVLLFLAAFLPYVQAEPVKPFSDVPKDHWAYSAILALQQQGILIGYPDTEYLRCKSSYDLSSPQNTWKSLLLAMQRRDEDGVQYVTTEQCFESKENPMFKSSAKTLNKRLTIYQKRSKSWSEWVNYIPTPKPHAVEMTASLSIDTRPEMRFPGCVYFADFKKTEEGWKLDLIYSAL